MENLEQTAHAPNVNDPKRTAIIANNEQKQKFVKHLLTASSCGEKIFLSDRWNELFKPLLNECSVILNQLGDDDEPS